MAGERKIVAENLRRVLLREFLMNETKRAGFGGLDIQRTPMGTRLTLIAERPGLVIGRKGASIKALTDAVSQDFQFDNPQIEVQEVPQPALNAQIMAEKLASALERGWHFRRAGHSTLRRIMESGAKGCLITIAGKLTGQRHRTVKFKAGHVKYCGKPRDLWMERGFTGARLKQGIIGITVEVMDPKAKLPDEIEVIRLPAGPAPSPAPEGKPPAPAEGDAGSESAPEPAAKEIPPAVKAAVPPEPEEKKPKTRTSKVAAKRLKKAKQQLRREGADPDAGETDPEERAIDEPAEEDDS